MSVELSQSTFNPRLLALKVLNLTHQVVIGIKLNYPDYDEFEVRVLSLARPIPFSMRYLVVLLLAVHALRLSFPACAHAAQGYRCPHGFLTMQLSFERSPKSLKNWSC